MIFGDQVFIGRGCEFNIRDKLTVGDRCLIASNCVFVDHDHAVDAATGMVIDDCPSAPITLGQGVWLGTKVIILKGVNIGDNAVVGAGSVVTKSIPSGELWVGNPARKLRELRAS